MVNEAKIVAGDKKPIWTFSQPQHIGISRYSSNPAVGVTCLHDTEMSPDFSKPFVDCFATLELNPFFHILYFSRIHVFCITT